MKYCPLCATELAEIRIEGQKRLGCPVDGCEYVFWNNPTPVVAALVEGRTSLGEELAEFKEIVPEKLRPWPLGTGLAVRDWLKRREDAELINGK